jgi:hypothetical protein
MNCNGTSVLQPFRALRFRAEDEPVPRFTTASLHAEVASSSNKVTWYLRVWESHRLTEGHKNELKKQPDSVQEAIKCGGEECWEIIVIAWHPAKLKRYDSKTRMWRVKCQDEECGHSNVVKAPAGLSFHTPHYFVGGVSQRVRASVRADRISQFTQPRAGSINQAFAKTLNFRFVRGELIRRPVTR